MIRPVRVYKDFGGAKRCCSVDSFGDTFVHRDPDRVPAMATTGCGSEPEGPKTLARPVRSEVSPTRPRAPVSHPGRPVAVAAAVKRRSSLWGVRPPKTRAGGVHAGRRQSQDGWGGAGDQWRRRLRSGR